MSLSIRVKKVVPDKDMNLIVLFENGITKRYDTKQLLEQFPIYEKLKDEAFFKLVQVDCGGCAVAWDEDVDISEVELWEGGTEIVSDKPFANEIEALKQAKTEIEQGNVIGLASVI